MESIDKAINRMLSKSSDRNEMVFANVSRPQAVRWAVEAPSKIFNCADVRTCGRLRVVTTWSSCNIILHNGSQGWPPCDPNLSQSLGNHRSVHLHAWRAPRGGLRSNAETGHLGPSTHSAEPRS
jgi:hypothetical protein